LFATFGAAAALGVGLLTTGALTATADTGQIVTYTHTISIPAPPSSTFSGASGGGDGWGVGLTSTQLFNVFHHNSALIVNCHNQSDASTCWASPKLITDSGVNFGTPGEPGLWVDQASGHLFVFATRASDGTGGVVCIDTTQPASAIDPFCGFTALTAAGEAPLNYGSWSEITDPVVIGTKWYAFNYVSGTPTGGEDKLLCFDLATLGACAGQPYAVPLGASVSIETTVPSPAIGSSSSEIFIPFSTPTGDQLTCFDASNGAACGGAWPIAIAEIGGAPFPLLDGTGAPKGICLPTSPIQCFDLTGASVSTPSDLDAVVGATTRWNGPAFVLGPRVYVANGYFDSVTCYDFNTGKSCSKFPKDFSSLDLGFLYSTNPDPQRPSCIWVNADNGGRQIQNFDAYTGGACGQGPLRVLAASVVAPQSQCAPTSWVSLQLTTPPPSGYTSGTVQFLDNDGFAISGLPTQPLDSTGSVDLTSLNLTQNGLPQFLVTLTGAPSTLTQAVVVLTWKGTYSQACVTSGTTTSGLITTTTTTTAPAAPPTAPLQGATTVHTGEPWAGSRPIELGVAELGMTLIFAGVIRRRSTRTAETR
jgi:hypothetical protein